MASRKDSKNKVLHKGESQRSDGRYIYRWTQDGKTQTIYAKNLDELRKKEKQIEKERINGIDHCAQKITLNQLFQTNMELKAAGLREGTKALYESMWNYNVKDSLGRQKICDIKQVHVKKFYSDCVAKGLKRNTIKTLHNLIYSTLELGVESDYILKNPARNTTKDLKADATEKTPLTSDQMTNVIDFCKKDTVYSVYVPFLKIAFATGLRVGEITGLQWSDVDLKKRTVDVNHQLTYRNIGDGCRFYITETKTEAGRRIIPLTQEACSAFTEIRKQNMLVGKRCTAEIDGYNDFVFINAQGNPYAANAIDKILYNIEKAYNKEHSEEPIPHLSAHVLRHTACTIFASRGMDVKALQNILGHTDASITMNIYNHSSFERTEKEIQRIERAMIL
ncbi:MAG: site-specific integrase [Lachnospiraceae bacterium]|nr:site-specific integrase [Lachnospiraceae bacterium]